MNLLIEILESNQATIIVDRIITAGEGMLGNSVDGAIRVNDNQSLLRIAIQCLRIHWVFIVGKQQKTGD